MKSHEVEQRAVELFEGGLHCAEAVLTAVLEGQGLPTDLAPRAASAFGAGVGRSKKALCGALSGGYIALGLAQGRNSAHEGWNDIAAKADALRKWFAGEYGCSRCEVVLEKLGPQEGGELCVALTGRVAAKFHDAINTPATAQASSCCCTSRQAPVQAKARASAGCGCK